MRFENILHWIDLKKCYPWLWMLIKNVSRKMRTDQGGAANFATPIEAGLKQCWIYTLDNSTL